MKNILSVDLSIVLHANYFTTLQYVENGEDIDREKFYKKVRANIANRISQAVKLVGPLYRVFLAADLGTPFRSSVDEGYKSGRSSKPGYYDLKEFVQNSLKDDYFVIEHESLEADDLHYFIQIACERALPEFHLYIHTSDHDSYQLIRKDTSVITPKQKLIDNKSGTVEAMEKVLKGCKGDMVPRIVQNKALSTLKIVKLISYLGSPNDFWDIDRSAFDQACSMLKIDVSFDDFRENLQLVYYSLNTYNLFFEPEDNEHIIDMICIDL